MARFTFSQEDILRGTLIQKPKFYDLEITGVEDVTAGTGSEGSKITVKILDKGEYEGVPIDVYYYTNGAGFAKNFLIGLGAKVVAGSEFEFNQKMVGKRLQGYCKWENDNKGKPRNVVADWRPIAAKSAA